MAKSTSIILAITVKSISHTNSIYAILKFRFTVIIKTNYAQRQYANRNYVIGKQKLGSVEQPRPAGLQGGK